MKERELKKSNRGGRREGSGRPSTNRHKAVTIRLSIEAWQKLQRFKNKSRYIENLIMGDE